MTTPESTAWILLGCAILAFLGYDVFHTTMGVGGGVLTRTVTRLLWNLVDHAARRRQGPGLLAAAGIALILIAFGLWIVLLWLGWSLIFYGGADAVVVEAATMQVGGWWERVYFTGVVLFTLGLGDYRPLGTVWQLITPFASLNGLFLVTFSISYLVPVIGAASHKRQVAQRIWALGETPQEILINHWANGNLHRLEQQILSLQGPIAALQQQHITYPVLHYMHVTSPVEAIAIRVACLDEALTMASEGIRNSEQHMDTALVCSTRRLVASFLDVLASMHLPPSEEAPPLPRLEPLRRHGMPMVDDEEFEQRLQDPGVHERRCLLRGFVSANGWTWDQVTASPAQQAQSQA